MNAFENYRTEIDGIPNHFLRAFGKGPNPIPLILSHVVLMPRAWAEGD